MGQVKPNGVAMQRKILVKKELGITRSDPKVIKLRTNNLGWDKQRSVRFADGMF
jgi:hypothetical protein